MSDSNIRYIPLTIPETIIARTVHRLLPAARLFPILTKGFSTENYGQFIVLTIGILRYFAQTGFGFVPYCLHGITTNRSQPPWRYNFDMNGSVFTAA